MNEILIERLTRDVLNDLYFRQLHNRCSVLNGESTFAMQGAQLAPVGLALKELKDALRFADILSGSMDPAARNAAYQLITFLNAGYAQHPFYKTVAKAVYAKLGNFPALNYLEKKNDNLAEIPFYRVLEMESKKLIQAVPDSGNMVFTDSQFELFSRLSNSTAFSFSGPTSMGKSFIIKAFIKKALKNSPKENLVILVPTRALINQFAFDLKHELAELLTQYKYKVITNSNVSELATEEVFNYLMILTPERLISFLSNDKETKVGFLFVDEAHKLAQQKDARSVTTYNAIERSLTRFGNNLKLYFSSPNVSNPEVFLKLFNRESVNNVYQTDESPVSQNLYFIDLEEKTVQSYERNLGQQVNNLPFNPQFLDVYQVIQQLGRRQNNLVYNNSKLATIQAAKHFADMQVLLAPIPDEVAKATDQIKEYVHPEYYLAELLVRGVAYHHGKLPQLIRNLVEDLYKKELVTNVFCTSTLLEGVNMPTKNLFILNNKNGLNKLEEIDFWNLTGRAGRLNVELSGNIYCVKHEGCQWENKDMILVKRPIKLTPTVIAKIDANLQRIEKILLEKDISGSETEKEILQYIANIICIDSLQTNSSYQSPLIDKLIKDKKAKIVELARKRGQDITVPLVILNANPSININIQQKVYLQLQREHREGKNIKLPSGNLDKPYEICKALLERLYDLYDWEKVEKKLKHKGSMAYYAMLMNKWINGFSLSAIIQQAIDYTDREKGTIAINYNEYVPFDKEDPRHVNILIELIIDDIEYVLRFLFEKYFNQYYQVVIDILGEDQAGENWANLLEYGTQNRVVIALQNIGVSRHTAISIYNKGRAALMIEDSKLKSVNKEVLLKLYKKNSIEYDEISRML
jgi:superfamily II DNA/RNA helicase